MDREAGMGTTERDLKAMTRILLFVVLAAAPLMAQGLQTGIITKWDTETFSQSAHITRDHVVYFVDADGKHYKIARYSREDKPEFHVGDRLSLRFEKNNCYVVKPNGKESKYEILGQE